MQKIFRVTNSLFSCIIMLNVVYTVRACPYLLSVCECIFLSNTSSVFIQYLADTEYQGLEVSIYISYFMDGDRDNNYTLLIRKDNFQPVVLHFIGYDRLFGSHYDEYDIVYTEFIASAPDPSVFEYQKGNNFSCFVFSFHLVYGVLLSFRL